MSVFFGSLKTVLIFMLLAVPGFVLGKTGLMDRRSLGPIGSILIKVALPFLAAEKLLLTDPLSVSPALMVISLCMPLVLLPALILIGKLLFRSRSHPFGGDRQVCLLCGAIANVGFMGIPLADMMFPDDPEIMVYLSMFNAVSSYLLLTLGVGLLTDKKASSLKEVLLTPMNAAFVFGLIGAFLHVNDAVPEIRTYCGYLGAMATPLSMTVLGFEFSQTDLRHLPKNIGFFRTILMKLVISPFLAAALVGIVKAVLPETGTAFAYAIFIAAAVPSASSSSTLADRYGRDGRAAMLLTLGDTLLSVLTLPLVFSLADLLF